MQTNRALMALLSFGLAGMACAPAQAESPLSAIDWLSQSVSMPPGTVIPQPGAPINEPGVTIGAVPGDVSVSILGAASPDAIGLLAGTVTGLPRNLWGLGRTEEIAMAITAERAASLPSLQTLMLTLISAEAEAPADSGGRGILLLARIDKLLAMGALDQAQGLLSAAGDGTADLFRRSFDVALLLGSENLACEKMRALPELAPTFPARVFCLARAGDWNAAALSLRTGEALDQISAPDVALLSRFLDPDLYEGEAPLPVPDKPTPLIWRMYEAIGEPLPTSTLPLAFSYAELGPRAGWKAQIEAAERLTRVGAISPNSLLGIYTERQPAASGGVWDRVDAFQRIDEAVQSGNTADVAKALPTAWARMSEAELEVPFASLYAKDLIRLQLPGPAGALAFRIALLSDQYERAALARKPADATEAFLIAVAKGQTAGVVAPNALARAIAPAFGEHPLSEEAEALMDQRRVGELILFAIDRIQGGARGDLIDLTEGLAILRKVGLEDVARRCALELLLLERRG
jgi:hypothetical protein